MSRDHPSRVRDGRVVLVPRFARTPPSTKKVENFVPPGNEDSTVTFDSLLPSLSAGKIVVVRPSTPLIAKIIQERVPAVVVNASERETRDGWLQFIVAQDIRPGSDEAASARATSNSERVLLEDAAHRHGFVSVGSVKHAIRVPTRFLKYVQYRR